MKFLHTADWQIGMKAVHVGEAGKQVRDERFATAQRVIDTARNEKADFILIAGDLFEDNGIERILIQRVVDVLSESNVPIYIIAGNHDPLIPYGSVWDHPVWQTRSHIHICRERKPISVPGGTIFPCPLHEKFTTENPTAWIPAKTGNDIRIGLAHGSVETLAIDDGDNPIPTDAARKASLDYLALGHWHSTLAFDDNRMAYSGTHEQTKFGESNSGNVLIVTIDQAGGTPIIEPVKVGRLRWLQKEEGIRGLGQMADLVNWLDSLEKPDTCLLDIKLSGLLFAGDAIHRDRLRELASRPRVLYGRVDASGLLAAPQDDAWIEDLPAGLYRDAAQRLAAWADPARQATGISEPNAEVASLALLQLYWFSQEKAA